MPKLGMEPLRRSALVEATIHEIGERGSLDVTVSQLAKRAGMSSALAQHYFGSKEHIFTAAMRHILSLYGAEVRGALAMAKAPRDRIEAIIRASFSPRQFQAEPVSAWLNIYQRRLRSNLRHAARAAGGDGSELARGLSAMIDGLYLRQALAETPLAGEEAIALLMSYLDRALSDPS